MQAELSLQQVQRTIEENFRPMRSSIEGIESGRQVLAEAIEAVVHYQRRSKVAQFAAGLFDGLAGGFLALSVLLFIQSNASLAFGFLGPAAASIVGSIAFRSRKILIG